jgi:hypothetical protein
LLVLGDVRGTSIEVAPEVVGPIDTLAFQPSFTILASGLHILGRCAKKEQTVKSSGIKQWNKTVHTNNSLGKVSPNFACGLAFFLPAAPLECLRCPVESA